MHAFLDTGKCVVSCTACLGAVVVGTIAVLAVALNLLKLALF